MAKDIGVAWELIRLTPQAKVLLTSLPHPIVLAPARMELEGVAPENCDLGIMLPYTPVQHLLFAAGAPDALVMTSANSSSEPIAYHDADALERLSGIADAFLIGERPIARRVDDSIARAGTFGPVVLRRLRGYAPAAVARLPIKRPVLAVGADLKNTITLVVDGQAFVSQHIGDLSHYQAFQDFTETIKDLISMYDIRTDDLLLVHDAHPQYVSSGHASALPVRERHAVQHHRAHLASVLAERGEWQKKVVGAAATAPDSVTTEASGVARSSWAASKAASNAWRISVPSLSLEATARRTIRCRQHPDSSRSSMICPNSRSRPFTLARGLRTR
jgi:hydrogenase maturation protein HypF